MKLSSVAWFCISGLFLPSCSLALREVAVWFKPSLFIFKSWLDINRCIQWGRSCGKKCCLAVNNNNQSLRGILWMGAHFIQQSYWKFQVFSSHQTKVRVKSRVTDVKVQVELQVFDDIVKSSPKSSKLWLESDSSLSHMTRVHTSATYYI